MMQMLRVCTYLYILFSICTYQSVFVRIYTALQCRLSELRPQPEWPGPMTAGPEPGSVLYVQIDAIYHSVMSLTLSKGHPRTSSWTSIMMGSGCQNWGLSVRILYVLMPHIRGRHCGRWPRRRRHAACQWAAWASFMSASSDRLRTLVTYTSPWQEHSCFRELNLTSSVTVKTGSEACPGASLPDGPTCSRADSIDDVKGMSATAWPGGGRQVSSSDVGPRPQARQQPLLCVLQAIGFRPTPWSHTHPSALSRISSWNTSGPAHSGSWPSPITMFLSHLLV